MRRTLALVAGACTAVVLAGATAYAMTGDPVPADPAGTAQLGRAAAPERVAAEPAPAQGPEAAQPVAPAPKSVGAFIDAVGRQQAGALESVDSMVGYHAESDTQTLR